MPEETDTTPTATEHLPASCDGEQERPGLSSTTSAECCPSVRDDLVNCVRGFCMGAADTVPGVSGGTVALILGHYERLIRAITNLNRQFVLDCVRNFPNMDGLRRADVRFLLALGLGMVSGVVLLAGLMHWLLEFRRPETYAAFFGLILASVWIVKNQINRWSASRFVAMAIGIVIAVAVGLAPTTSGSHSLIYLFVSGAIAICAMILPGISGAFVLLLLGVYHPITGLIKGLAHGDVNGAGLLTMVVFTLGCLSGLLGFSRVLRRLLAHHHDTTMAGLTGLMVGSIAKLWPLQYPTTETAMLEAKYQRFDYVAPQHWDGTPATVLALIAVAACVAVLVVERVAHRRHQH